MSRRGGPGRAAVFGALGCFGSFLLLGLLVAATGGFVYADAGGVIVLLIIGAIIGLVVYAIYERGRRDASDPLRGAGSPGGPSVDELLRRAEEDLREGRITRDEYERRRRRAWEGRE